MNNFSLKSIVLIVLLSIGCASFVSAESEMKFDVILDSKDAFVDVIECKDDWCTLKIEIEDNYYLYKNSIELRPKVNSTSSISSLASLGTQNITFFDQTPHNIVTIQDPLDINQTLDVYKDLLILSFKKEYYKTIDLHFLSCHTSGFCFPPEERHFSIPDSDSGISWYWMWSMAFGLGILMALAPCVLPVLPILIHSFKRVHSFLWAFVVYIGTLIVTWTLIGVLASSALLELGSLMQNQYFMYIIGLSIFIMGWMYLIYKKGLSFSNTVQSKLTTFLQSKNGYHEIAFTGVLSSVLSSSCISGPLISFVLLVSAQPEAQLTNTFSFAFLGIGYGLILGLVAFGFNRLSSRFQTLSSLTPLIIGILLIFSGIWFIQSTGNYFLISLLVFILSIHIGVKYFLTRKKLFLLTVLAGSLLAITSYASFNQSTDDYIRTEEDLISQIPNDEAFFLYFRADWCMYCIQFKEQLSEIHTDIPILIIDITQDDFYKNVFSFEVPGVPSFVFLENNDYTPIGYDFIAGQTDEKTLETFIRNKERWILNN